MRLGVREDRIVHAPFVTPFERNPSSHASQTIQKRTLLYSAHRRMEVMASSTTSLCRLSQATGAESENGACCDH